MQSIPTAVASTRTTTSYGCTGMRINSGMSDELMLMVIPGKGLDAALQGLSQTLEVNQRMEQHYRDKIAALG